MNNFSKYLPSKKFSLVMGGVLGVIVIIFALFYIFSGKISFISGDAKDKNSLAVEGKTVNDLIQADADLDGIADWEEALWGTDKNKKATFDDTPDSTYIANKKKDLNVEQATIQEEESLTETEKFAREFFASFTALKASGEVDATTINNFSSALGQNMVSSEIPDTYSEKDILKSADDTAASRESYYHAVKALFDKHKDEGLGNELGIVSEGLAASGGVGTTPEVYAELSIIGDGYQTFAKEMIAVETPASLAGYHLKIANSAHSTGQSILSMQKMVEDPILGIAGLSQYQKHSAELIAVVAILEEALAREE